MESRGFFYQNKEEYREDLENCIRGIRGLEKLMGKTLMVTGASGMIGSFLVDVLMRLNADRGYGIKIYAVSRNGQKLKKRFAYWEDFEVDRQLVCIEADVSVPGFYPDIAADYYVIGASNTHPIEYTGDPVGTIMTNVMGTKNVLDMAVKYGLKGNRTCLLSSVEIYGEAAENTSLFSEGDMGYIDCATLRAGYPESKRVAESLLQAYRWSEGLDVVTDRLCRIYGPTVEQDDTKASSQFIRRAARGEDIVLKSEGKQLYSYLYIADAVSAILTIMTEGESGEVYNISDPSSDISLKKMTELLSRITGSSVIYEIPDRLEAEGYSRAERAVLDSCKLKKLGWRAAYSIEEGLSRTCRILAEP